MERFRLILAAALLGIAGCTVKEDPEILQEEQVFGTMEVSLSNGLTKVALMDTPGGRTVVWDMDDTFRIYDVADASYKEVKPIALGPDGFTATLPLPYPIGKDKSIVVTFGGTEFRKDSTITAASPIEQVLRIDGFDCSLMPMSSPIIPLEKDRELKVELRPLNALVEVELSRTPNNRTDKIRNIHITASAKRGTRSNQFSCDAYLYQVDRAGFSLELEKYLTDKFVFEGEYASYLELTAPELLSYGSSTKLYFMSPGYVQPDEDEDGTILQSLVIDITTDKNIIHKEFSSLDAKKVKFIAGRLTSFTLNMASGTTVTPRLDMGVEWSPGYLVYDAATKGYGFAGPQDRGLYFKIGSLMGFDPFSSTPPEEYFGHTRRLAAYVYDDNGNVTFTDYYDTSWEDGTADLKAYRKDSKGDIVPFKPASYADLDYLEYAESISYDRMTHDPCAYVHDGKGDWRLPTEAELTRLTDIIKENIGNWRVWSYGEDVIHTVDNKPHIIGVTDKSGQEVDLSTTSTISHGNYFQKNTSTWNYSVELTYSESIYIPSRDFTSYVLSEQGYVGTSIMAITSLTSLRCNYECDARIIRNSYNNATALRQNATMVRCVRDK